MREVIMGYQGEMSLKGLNRNQFESTMMKILRYRLKTVGKFRVYCTQSTFYMEPEEEDIDMDLAFERVSKVFGLAALSRAVVCEKDFDTICQTAEDYLGDSLHGIKTFKVEARRSDKTFPMTSPELMRELGAYLLGRHNYLRVDVKNPQFKVIVEIRDYGAYIHGPKIQGEGGLPVGTSGRALNMLSGGIDSPVAAYRMAKRGLGLDHIHFASPPYTSERAKLKVKALAQLITPYTGSTNLFVVPTSSPRSRAVRPSSPARAWHRWPARPSRLCSVPTPPRTCPSSDPSSAWTRPRSSRRPATSTPSRRASCPMRTAAPSSPRRTRRSAPN